MLKYYVRDITSPFHQQILGVHVLHNGNVEVDFTILKTYGYGI